MKGAILADYQSGLSGKQIAEKYGVSKDLAWKYVREAGGTVRPRGSREKQLLEHVASAALRYRNGETVAAIAKDLGTSSKTLSRALKKQGCVITTQHDSGPDAHKWSGGRTMDGYGYVLLKIPKTHPFFENANHLGYIREHRLVMSVYLNRLLTKHETVHHIDGNRQNNCLENLQLRIGLHGKGAAYVCACCGSKNIKPVEIQS